MGPGEVAGDRVLCVCMRVCETRGIDMLGMKLGADGQSRLDLCRSCEFWLLVTIRPLMD